MNNKGFAITTIVYGLSILGILLVMILMSTLSSTRSRSREMSETIEQELNRFSKASTVFKYKDNNLQEYYVPSGESGWYRIELWGAQGGSSDGAGGYTGGYGAYTTGIIYLKENQKLYFKIGKAGTADARDASTDVRIHSTTESGGLQVSLDSRIMVAASGGSEPVAHGGTLCGYGAELTTIGGKLEYSSYGLATGTLLGTPAGYPAGYENCAIKQDAANKKVSARVLGGDGYYYSKDDKMHGGISFISGYLGGKAIIKGSVTSNPTYTDYPYSGGYSNSGAKKYYFVDGLMLPGVRKGEGKASIEKIIAESEDVTELPRRNKKLNNVKEIEDCINYAPQATSDAWKEISAIYKGNVLAGTYSNKTNCKVFTLNTASDVDEIMIRHKAGVDYLNHTIRVKDASGTYKYIKNYSSLATGGYTRTETVTGTRISAYQPDMTEKIPDTGNYYIFSVLSENTVLSAFKDALDDSNPLYFELLQGENRQKWSIELINKKLRQYNPTTHALIPEYKIVELTRYKALEIYLDENREKNKIAATENFNVYQRNDPQIWTLQANKDGTYSITTIVTAFSDSIATGNIVLDTVDRSTNYNAPMNVIIGKQNAKTARFWLYAIDYSSQ